MKSKFLLLLVLLSLQSYAQKTTSEVYELRIYHCFPNRVEALKNRFANHTTKLFEKHGMKNIGYWLPTTEGNNDLVYILSYPSMEARNASWKAFMNDPEWQAVQKKSEEEGKIVSKVDAEFLTLNPELTKKLSLKTTSPERLFELRSYYCFPNRFPAIVARFRDHTRKLFKKHGMTNVAYWSSIEKDGTQPHLVYLLAYKDADSAKKSWDGFRADPKWLAVKSASEADGKIVEKVVSVYMKPLPFSAIR